MAKENDLKAQPTMRFKRCMGIGLIAVASTILCSEVAMAGFDVDAGVDAATKPIIDGIKAHWGKGVLMTGAGSALIGEGDPRQRAVRAGIGAGSAGMIILGLVALLT